MDEHDFGYNLKKILMKRGMTQKSLAEAIDIDPVTLNRFVKGDRKIPLPTLKTLAEYLNIEPQNLFGTDDDDILLWKYSLLEGAQIDIDKGIEQALEQGRDKSFIYPILRKYYTKQEMQDLVDSYDASERIKPEVWPQDKNNDEGLTAPKDRELAELKKKLEELKNNTIKVKSVSTAEMQTDNKISGNINLVPPESLFAGIANVEDKKALLDSYFRGMATCVGNYNKS